MATLEFYGEEECIRMMQEDPDFGWIGYVNHNTPEMKEAYENFCTERGLYSDLEESADAFMEFWQNQFDQFLQQ